MQQGPLDRIPSDGMRSAAALASALLLASLAVSGGCRNLSCVKATDEAISASRQLSLQGISARQQGDWERAENCYASAVQRCPADERARCGYAESLWKRGAREEAVAHMEEAVRLSGNDPERLVQLGRMYFDLGQLARAANQAGRAIAANRESPSAWALRGDVLRAQGNREDALASYHRALSLQPNSPEVQLSLVELYSQLNRPERALATLQSLIDAYPADGVPPEIRIREGLVLRKLGRHSAAADALASAAEKGGASPELLYELAQTRLLDQDRAGASLALSMALRQDPNHPPSLRLHQELETGPIPLTAVANGPLQR